MNGYGIELGVYALFFVLGCVFLYFVVPPPAEAWDDKVRVAAIFAFAGYLTAGLACGWRMLGQLMSGTQLIATPIGWLFYAWLKATISFVVGPFLLPIRLAFIGYKTLSDR